MIHTRVKSVTANPILPYSIYIIDTDPTSDLNQNLFFLIQPGLILTQFKKRPLENLK